MSVALDSRSYDLKGESVPSYVLACYSYLVKKLPLDVESWPSDDVECRAVANSRTDMLLVDTLSLDPLPSEESLRTYGGTALFPLGSSLRSV